MRGDHCGFSLRRHCLVQCVGSIPTSGAMKQTCNQCGAVFYAPRRRKYCAPQCRPSIFNKEMYKRPADRFCCTKCGKGEGRTIRLYKGVCDPCHMDMGRDFTSGNFSLGGLTYEERMLVFMWAAGQDISAYFESKQTYPAEVLPDDVLEHLKESFIPTFHRDHVVDKKKGKK